MVSPVSRAPRPSDPAGQCSTAAPSKWPPIRATVTPGTGWTCVVEELDPRRGPLDPCPVGVREQHAGVEGVGDVDVGRVEVRVRDADGGDAAEVARSAPARRRRAAGRSPTARCRRGADQQRPLPDGDGRGDADAEQVGLLLAQLARRGRGQLGRAWSSAGRPSRRTAARPGRSGSSRAARRVSGYCTAQVTQIQAGMKDRRHGVSAARQVGPVRSRRSPSAPWASAAAAGRRPSASSTSTARAAADRDRPATRAST